MTSELRPAVEVWAKAYEDSFRLDEAESEQAAAAVIEADREAVRAEQAAELAKFKALAETLAGALELYAQWGGDTAREALRQYKEATDV